MAGRLCFWICCALAQLICMNLALQSEYIDRIGYCLSHLSSSVKEDLYFEQLSGSDFQTRVPQRYETVEQCFRDKFFTFDVESLNCIFIQATPSSLAESIAGVTNVSSSVLVIDILDEEAENLENSDGQFIKFIYKHQLDISNIELLQNLKELWIIKSKARYNSMFTLSYKYDARSPLPLERLHINVPLFAFNVSCTFFERFSNLSLLNLDETSYIGVRKGFADCPQYKSMSLLEVIVKQLDSTKLQVLSLSNFRLPKIMTSSGPVWKNLRNEHVETDDNSLWKLAFEHTPNLVYLNLSRNNMDNTYNDIWRYRQELRILDVSYNNIWPNVDRIIIDIFLLSHLTVFKINHQFSGHSFIRKRRDIELNNKTINCEGTQTFTLFDIWDVQKFCYKIVCSFVQGDISYYNFCLSTNFNINQRTLFDINCPHYFRCPLPRNLHELNMVSTFSDPYNQVKYLYTKMCSGNNTLRYLNFSRNAELFYSYGVQDLFNSVELDMPDSHVKILDVSFNKITFSRLQLFGAFHRLQKLILDGNYFVNNSLDTLCFILPRIRTLGLSHCNISVVSRDMFKMCNSLRYLDMSYNDITSLSGAIFTKLRLKILKLQGNNLFVIDDRAFDMLEVSLAHGFLDLSNNKFRCGCNKAALQTVYRLKRTKLNLVNENELTCLSEKEGGELFLKQLDVRRIHDECFPSLIPYVVTALCASAVSIMIAVAVYFLYKNRYRLKTTFYKFKYGRISKSRNARFDCYVSHSHADRYWVYYVLGKTLEDHYNFNLCIPDRDFAMGVHIDEIITRMDESQCIMLILSESYITDALSRCDLALAFEQWRRKGKTMIAVKLGNISPHAQRLDPKSGEILDSKRFIEWPEQNDERETENGLNNQHKLFWSKMTGKLYKSLAVKRTVTFSDTNNMCRATDVSDDDDEAVSFVLHQQSGF